MKIHIAAVCTATEVRMLTGAPTSADLQRRLAAYVQRYATHLLWPAESARVLRLLEHDRPDEAISFYFSSVGNRWDHEFLHVQTLDLENPRDETVPVTSGLGRRVRQSILREL